MYVYYVCLYESTSYMYIFRRAVFARVTGPVTASFTVMRLSIMQEPPSAFVRMAPHLTLSVSTDDKMHAVGACFDADFLPTIWTPTRTTQATRLYGL
jgi:hypothetical protein